MFPLLIVVKGHNIYWQAKKKKKKRKQGVADSNSLQQQQLAVAVCLSAAIKRLCCCCFHSCYRLALVLREFLLTRTLSIRLLHLSLHTLLIMMPDSGWIGE